MPNYKISDAGDPRKYYTQIPNIIDDMNLSVYAFRLYVHLKRVAGEDGTCWQSTNTLAKACRVGMASISRAKNELVSNRLIDIELADNPKGGKPYHKITINDIWLANSKKYDTTSPQEFATSKGELATSPQEVTTSPQEIKNNPLRITHEEYLISPEEKARQQTLAALNNGYNKDSKIKDDIYVHLSITPNWNTKSAKEFLLWVKERPAEQTIHQFSLWWYEQDWRGKQGQPPTIQQIQELWPQAFKVQEKEHNSARRKQHEAAEEIERSRAALREKGLIQ